MINKKEQFSARYIKDRGERDLDFLEEFNRTLKRHEETIRKLKKEEPSEQKNVD